MKQRALIILVAILGATCIVLGIFLLRGGKQPETADPTPEATATVTPTATPEAESSLSLIHIFLRARHEHVACDGIANIDIRANDLLHAVRKAQHAGIYRKRCVENFGKLLGNVVTALSLIHI